MKARKLAGLPVLLILLLGILAAVWSARVAAHFRGVRLELGRVKLSRLDEETRRRLETLKDDVFITYYVSERSRMPSNMRRVERGVTDLLEALRGASRGRLGYQIVDPGTDADLVRFASHRGVAPFRSRSVERDSYSERTVWSTLGISHGPRAESAINGIGPEHLPRLQKVLMEYLNQLGAFPPASAGEERPRKAVIALASGGRTRELAAALSEKARVVEVDLQAGMAIPPEADVLFWIDPGEVTPAHLRQLQQFLDRGRSVLVSGSELRAEYREADGKLVLTLKPSGFAAEALLAHFGLRPVRGLVLDKSAEQVPFKDQRIDAPFLLRCNPYQQNFRGLKGQPNGGLVFLAPTPLALVGEELAERGWSAQVLATTSDQSYLDAIPQGPVSSADLTLPRGEPVPKQPLMVLLKPADPWRGSLIACGASTPFVDGFLAREGAAHRRLLQTLLENLTPLDRLVINRAGILRPEPLPEMSWTSRFAWRGAALVPWPALLLAIALWRGAFPRRPPRALERRTRAWGFALRGALALAAAVLAVRFCATAADVLRLDLTAERLNELAPETRALAAKARGEAAVRAEIYFSPQDRLPPSLRPFPKRMRAALGELQRAGADVAVSLLHPEDLDREERGRLSAQGIEPVKITTRDEETTTVRTVYSAVRLSSGSRSEVLRFPGAASFENLEFRLAFALWRLQTGRQPHIAFASDTPRLSAAEAYELYQQQQLFAPMGTDVYSLARGFLEGCDFRVTHLNTREPVLPEKMDLLVWLQPRRPVEKLLNELVRYLHQGGHVLLAAQHFNIQSRQYRGTEYKLADGTPAKGFHMVYWPQPQAPDLERYYFPEIGIDMVREVLFDELRTYITTDTQVNRASMRPDFDQQTSALPFLVRAAAANFNRSSPITRGAGDQAFIWGSFIRWDEAKLKAQGIRATPLITTSEKAWSFLWKGGWIPEEMLEGPPPGPKGKPQWLGKLPLAVLFEGQFPLKEIVRPENAAPFGPPTGAAPPAGTAAPPPATSPTPPSGAPPAAGPPAGAATSPAGTAGPPPAAAIPSRAAAPPPAAATPTTASPTPPAGAAAEEAAPAAPGTLLLIGSSEMFKNHRLLVPGFRADHLLLNAVAALALPAELAAVASRRPVIRGFDYLEPGSRLNWRTFVLLAGPALFCLLAVAYRLSSARTARARVERLRRKA